MRLSSLLLVIFLSFLFTAKAQNEIYYRIRADFSIKEKCSDGKANLTMGQVFYDRMNRRIVYKVLFPEKEVWLFQDTVMYKVKNEHVERFSIMPGYIDFSIFNLALCNDLKNYGLRKSGFSVSQVEKEEEMVISTWSPANLYKKALGDVKISMIDNRLNGVVFFNPEKKMVGKQLFTNYQKIRNFEFPAEILSYSFLEDGSEIHQLTTFRNIKVNDWNEDFYNYTLPAK